MSNSIVNVWRNWFAMYVDKYFQTGSTIICNPPVEGTDVDFIGYVDSNEKWQRLVTKLLNNNFVLGGSTNNFGEVNTEFLSYKRTFNLYNSVQGPYTETVNFIITTNDDFFNNSYLATALSKKLNLLNKEDRITVFRAVREDIWPEFEDLPVKVGTANEQTD